MSETKLTSNGLKNSLKNYSISEADSEYIWNGFDAKATLVEIKEDKNQLGLIEYLGIGIGENRND